MEIAIGPSLALFFTKERSWHQIGAAVAVTVYAILRSLVGDMTFAGNMFFGLFLFLRLARLDWEPEWTRIAQTCALISASVVDTLSTDPKSLVYVVFFFGSCAVAIDTLFYLNRIKISK
jgi:hypothetical protein